LAEFTRHERDLGGADLFTVDEDWRSAGRASGVGGHLGHVAHRVAQLQVNSTGSLLMVTRRVTSSMVKVPPPNESTDASVVADRPRRRIALTRSTSSRGLNGLVT